MTHHHEKYQSMETNPEVTDIVELVDSDLITVINMLNDVKQHETIQNEAQREQD